MIYKLISLYDYNNSYKILSFKYVFKRILDNLKPKCLIYEDCEP